MTSRELIFMGVGVVVGAAATYVVMDRMFEKELDEIYGEIEDEAEKTIGLIKKVSGDIDEINEIGERMFADPNVKLSRAVSYIQTPEEKDINIESAIRETIDAPIEEEFSEEIEMDLEDEDESSEEEDEDVGIVTEYNGIFIIRPDEVSGRQVVGEYNHDNGSVTVAKMMSVASESFDDVIENDALYSLINDEAFDILMNSEPSEDPKDRRILAVRNNVINLDFVITY